MNVSRTRPPPSTIIVSLTSLMLLSLSQMWFVVGVRVDVSSAQVLLDGTTGGVAGQALGAGILPNGQTLSDGSTMTNHLIPHDAGTLIDHNLFHSFQDFSISFGKSATFTGPNTIHNVLSRVTGGNPSDIQGKIASTIEDANLFLFNPNGVIFGPNATLDLRGSFNVSTADAIGFKKNGSVLNFYADVSLDGTSGSVLHVPSLEAFGFVGTPGTFGFTRAKPESIAIKKSFLVVPENESLSLVGGDLQITGDPPFTGNNPDIQLRTLDAPSGRIYLVSVSSAGEVVLANKASDVGVTLKGFTQLGHILLTKGGRVETTTLKNPKTSKPASENGGGTVVIRGGHLILESNSFIFSDTLGSEDGAPVGIDIEVTGELRVSDGSRITSENNPNVAGRTGDVRIRAGSLEVTGNNSFRQSLIGSRLFPGSTGDGGNVFIEAGTVRVTNEGDISTRTAGSGDPGDLHVTADTIHIASGGQMLSTTEGPGAGGAVHLTGIDSTRIDGADSGIFSETTKGELSESISPGGTITVQTSTLHLSNGAIISAATDSKGQAGTMNINIETLVGQDAQMTSSSTNPTTDAGPAGSIDIHARESIHLSRTTISTTVEGGTQPGGSITLQGGELVLLQNGTRVSATNNGAGVAGDVLIRGGDSSPAVKQENGQAIPLVNTIRLENSTVSTNSSSATGGNITLGADFLIDVIDSTIQSDIGEVTEGADTGGNIDLDPQFIVLQGNSLISARSLGSGAGGTVSLGRADTFILTDSAREGASFVDVSSAGGQAGQIIIRGAIQVLSQETTPSKLSFTSVARLFASRCAAQQEGRFSSIVERPPDGLPPAPGDFFSSPLTLDGPGGFLTQVVTDDGPPRSEATSLGFADEPKKSGVSTNGRMFLSSQRSDCPR